MNSIRSVQSAGCRCKRDTCCIGYVLQSWARRISLRLIHRAQPSFLAEASNPALIAKSGQQKRNPSIKELQALPRNSVELPLVQQTRGEVFPGPLNGIHPGHQPTPWQRGLIPADSVWSSRSSLQSPGKHHSAHAWLFTKVAWNSPGYTHPQDDRQRPEILRLPRSQRRLQGRLISNAGSQPCSGNANSLTTTYLVPIIGSASYMRTPKIPILLYRQTLKDCRSNHNGGIRLVRRMRSNALSARFVSLRPEWHE